MALLEIKDLHAEVGGTEILKGINLSVNAGEVHAIMGPNGSGKSTLSYTLAGRDGYEPSSGSVLYNGKDLLAMAAEERACEGLFLAFQYPVELPGVGGTTFLKHALNAKRKYHGEAELDAMEFVKALRAKERAEHVRRHVEASGQCRLFRRREKAQRNPSNGSA